MSSASSPEEIQSKLNKLQGFVGRNFMSRLIFIFIANKKRRLNSFQLKSLANLCLDLGKIIGASPLLKFFNREKLSLDREDILVIILLLVVFSFFVLLGLFFGSKIKIKEE